MTLYGVLRALPFDMMPPPPHDAAVRARERHALFSRARIRYCAARRALRDGAATRKCRARALMRYAMPRARHAVTLRARYYRAARARALRAQR